MVAPFSIIPAKLHEVKDDYNDGCDQSQENANASRYQRCGERGWCNTLVVSLENEPHKNYSDDSKEEEANEEQAQSQSYENVQGDQ